MDQDCDGTADNDAVDRTIWFTDDDEDGYGQSDTAQARCEGGTGLADADGDCDDTDGAISPAAIEVCNDIDDNCDASVDNDASDAQTWFTDGDGDGFGDGTPLVTCDEPLNSATEDGDCDDSDDTVYPDALELCDELDNDCDDEIDNGTEDALWYIDNDADGFGADGDSVESCEPIFGRSIHNTDCDDDNYETYPNAGEACNGVDDNCNGTVDENAGDATTWYLDGDNDGSGDPDDAIVACDAPTGASEFGDDCDDTDPLVGPEADERCNGLDDNCNELVDEDVETLEWYADVDEDNFGDEDAVTLGCEAPDGSVAEAGDCDDTDATVHPGAVETCDGRDEDCDEVIDNDVSPIDWYADADGDGYGDGSTAVNDCARPDGYVDAAGDCDDADDATYPGAEEACDGVDNDCDGDVDDGCETDTGEPIDTGGTGEGEPQGDRCGCSSQSGVPLGGWLLLGLIALARRRRGEALAA